MNVHVLIPAAGSGSRIGGDTRKQYLELARRLLVKELALAEGIEEDMVTERLENMVN